MGDRTNSVLPIKKLKLSGNHISFCKTNLLSLILRLLYKYTAGSIHLSTTSCATQTQYFVCGIAPLGVVEGNRLILLKI